MKRAILFLFILLAASQSYAADIYCGPSATGSASGADWNNVVDFDTISLARGNTYWIKGGTYSRDSFPSVAGTSLITIKKATVSSHNTSTGWSDSYGTTQAVFTSWAIAASYITIDGQYETLNSGTIPSQTATYGIKLNFTGTSAWSGVMAITGSYVTVKGVHSYTQNRSKIGNYDIRNVRIVGPAYVALYNCYIDGSGQDGVVLQGNHFLFDHCYFYEAGERHAHSPDYHGQTIYSASASDVVVRWSIFRNCEGQALWANDDGISNRIRFYGNVVFNDSTNNYSGGFNSTGGILQTPGEPAEASTGVYIYNNTIVNMPSTAPDGSGTNYVTYINHGNYATNFYVYNNLEYACINVGISGTVTAGYWSVGGGSTPSGVSNLQTGLNTSYFIDYSAYDYRLSTATSAGLSLTSQGWWSGGADGFFGTLDSALDMRGNARGSDGTWDRGAYEYASDVDTTPPYRYGGSPSGSLAQGTTQTTVSLSTSDSTPPSYCRHSTSPGTAWASMTVFTTTGGTSHSYTKTGLTDGGSYDVYVKCQDSVTPTPNTNPDDYHIAFSVSSGSPPPPTPSAPSIVGVTLDGAAIY